MKFYIYGVREKNAFNTNDGKRLVPVLLANARFDDLSLADDWASVYMLSDNIDTSVAYVPYYAPQRDGSYKRKFKKED